MDTLLSDGQKFSIEREFYCPTCKLLRDVCEANQDIVCTACCTTIATFKDRRVIDPKAPRCSLIQEAEESLTSAQSVCTEACAEAWVGRDSSDFSQGQRNRRLEITQRIGAIVTLIQQIKEDYEEDSVVMTIDRNHTSEN